MQDFASYLQSLDERLVSLCVTIVCTVRSLRVTVTINKVLSYFILNF